MTIEPSSETQPLAEAEKLAMARRIAESQTGPNNSGHYLFEPSVQAALAAIEECSEKAAKLASAYAAACTPTPTIGDDDSIYLTDREEGEKRAATVIAAKIRAADHLKGTPNDR